MTIPEATYVVTVKQQEAEDSAPFSTSSFGMLVAASDANPDEIANADYVCDGVNDEVEIQAAIDSIESGGTVYLSAGTFILSKAGEMSLTPCQGYCILIDENHPALQIIGQGWATVVKMADDQDKNTCLILVRGGGSTEKRSAQTILQDFYADGNRRGQSETWNNYTVIETGFADNVVLDRLYIDDPPYKSARFFLEAVNCRVQNCYFNCSNGMGGFVAESGPHVIFGNHFLGNDTSNNCILDLRVNDDRQTPAEFIQVQNNYLDRGKFQCVISGGRHIQFMGNVFVNSIDVNAVSLKLMPYNAVNDYHVYENVIFGNVFYNNRSCINLHSSGETMHNYRNLISNNQCIDGPDQNMTYGIYESGNWTDQNAILDNVIHGATIADVLTVGANTVVRRIWE